MNVVHGVVQGAASDMLFGSAALSKSTLCIGVVQGSGDGLLFGFGGRGKSICRPIHVHECFTVCNKLLGYLCGSDWLGESISCKGVAKGAISDLSCFKGLLG